jgi:integrase
MINRQNWLDTRAYLHHLEYCRDPSTIKRARTHLRHLLEWADETALPRARTIDQAYPAYLLTVRDDHKPGSLARASIVRALSSARLFLAWARIEWPQRYKSITESWLQSIQPSHDMRLQNDLRIHEFYSLEDIQKIAAVSIETLREQRAQAGACLLYLSGMRADALASIPVSCVDLTARQILQLPRLGVRTKNRKSAITYLLNIPTLFTVVQAWDTRVRAVASPESLWYSTLTRDGMALTQTVKAYSGRFDTVERDLGLICARAGVPYQSPHKLRHGHVVYALKNARTIPPSPSPTRSTARSQVTMLKTSSPTSARPS